MASEIRLKPCLHVLKGLVPGQTSALDRPVLTIGRIVLFPFSLLYLLAFAGMVHLRRKARA